jgi:hypothetical protein
MPALIWACRAFCSKGTCYNLPTLQNQEVVSMPALMKGMWSLPYHRNLLQSAYLAEPGGGVNGSSDVGQVEHSVLQEPLFQFAYLAEP